MTRIFRIGEYFFAPSHLVLWDSSIPEDKVFSLLPDLATESEGGGKFKDALFAHDWQSVHINPFQIDRIGICIAKNCNLRCRYCSECSTEGFGEEIPNDQVLSFVSDLMVKKVARSMVTGDESPLKIIFTGGGEPTYEFEKFCNLVVSIEELGERNDIPIYLDITTNGAYPKERMDFICRHFNSIMISYDGLPEVQDANRPSPHYLSTSKIVEESIKFVVEKGVPLIVRTTISPNDISRMKEMADFLFTKFGTDFTWSIFPMTPKGRAVQFKVDKDSMPDFFSEFQKLCSYGREKYGAEKISSPLFFNHRNDYYCGSLGFLTRVAWLRASGEIVTCLEMDVDQTVIGKLENGIVTYNEVCKDPLIAITQRKFVECESCIAFPFCRGGCPADHRACERMGETGISWACRQTISYWKYLIGEIVRGRRDLGWKLEEIKTSSGASTNVYKMMEAK